MGGGGNSPRSLGETTVMLEPIALLEFWLGLNLALAMPISFFKES